MLNWKALPPPTSHMEIIGSKGGLDPQMYHVGSLYFKILWASIVYHGNILFHYDIVAHLTYYAIRHPWLTNILFCIVCLSSIILINNITLFFRTKCKEKVKHFPFPKIGIKTGLAIWTENVKRKTYIITISWYFQHKRYYTDKRKFDTSQIVCWKHHRSKMRELYIMRLDQLLVHALLAVPKIW